MSSEPDLQGDLLALAREDLASAEALHRAERISDSPVGFHAQQAVEKALKAAIAVEGGHRKSRWGIPLQPRPWSSYAAMRGCRPRFACCTFRRGSAQSICGSYSLWPRRSRNGQPERCSMLGLACHRMGRCRDSPARSILTSCRRSFAGEQ